MSCELTWKSSRQFLFWNDLQLNYLTYYLLEFFLFIPYKCDFQENKELTETFVSSKREDRLRKFRELHFKRVGLNYCFNYFFLLQSWHCVLIGHVWSLFKMHIWHLTNTRCRPFTYFFHTFLTRPLKPRTSPKNSHEEIDFYTRKHTTGNWSLLIISVKHWFYWERISSTGQLSALKLQSILI